MEALNRARRPLRNELKKLISQTEKLMVEPIDKDAVQAHMRLITETYNELSEQDQKVKELMLDGATTEDALDDEYAKISEWKLKVETLRVRVDNLLTVSIPANVTSGSGSSIAGDCDGVGVRLPKYEFKSFSGNLLDWLGFEAQFDKVDKHPKLDGSQKFGYLLMQLEPGSEAYDLVSAFPPTSENYPEALDALRKRFGNKDVLLQVYIRELLKLVISNVDKKEKLPLSSLFTKVDSHLRALKTLNLATADPATWLYPLVESCLPEETLLTWMRSAEINADGTNCDPPKNRLDFLMEFLAKEVENRRRIGIAQAGFGGTAGDIGQGSSKQVKRRLNEPDNVEAKQSYGKRSRSYGNYPTVAGFQNVERTQRERRGFAGNGSVRDRLGQKELHKSTCVFCKKSGHLGIDCRAARFIPFEERIKIVTDEKLCFICLRRHFARECSSKIKCQLCGRDHCLPLCRQFGKNNQERRADTGNNKGTSSDNMIVEVSHNKSNRVRSCPVILQTIMVMVHNGGKRQRARVFFDSGSQRSYVLKSLAHQLGLQEKGVEVVAHELFGGNLTDRVTHRKYNLEISSLSTPYTCEIVVRDQDSISKSIPRIPCLPTGLTKELEKIGISFSDVGEDTPSVDILIGGDVYGQLLTGNVQKLSNGYVAVETRLGWTLLGQEGVHFREWMESAAVLSMNVSDYSVTQLWDLDTINVRDPIEIRKKDEEEAQVKNDFLKRITRDPTGRYVVPLPWKEGHPPLPDNFVEAEKRLQKTTKKLRSDGLYEVYEKILKEWESEGFIEEVSFTQHFEIVHYIPHRPVVKPGSLTTPVRIVFDASCRRGSAPSLNDCLHTGTNMIQQIPDILLRFREKKVGFVSDIRKAFQMIEVRKEDRDATRFLWWKDDGTLKVYRHKRVMFGATCSPFILGIVLKFHLTNLNENKEVGKKLFNSMYVDNCVASESSCEEYQTFRTTAVQMLSNCGMDLRMWMSNVEEVEDACTQNISVLGMMWDRKADCLYVKSEFLAPEKITKRTVLSATQRIFDIIGFTCPAVIPMKCLLQRVWINKMKWDEALPEEEAELFRKWAMEVGVLQQIKIPRLICEFNSDRTGWSLHTFNDSSKLAYGTVVFLRVEDNGLVTLRLLGAKARVAPVPKEKGTKITIPRLELMSCNIGAILGSNIRNALELNGVPEYYWSDSTTALSWIRRDDTWGTFVGNIVSRINKLTRKEDWKHVPGSLNPADLCSRGCTPTQLLESRWHEGPSFLLEPLFRTCWSEEIDEAEVQKERKKSVDKTCVAMTVVDSNGNQRSFSSWVRIYAYVNRFIYNCKHKARRVWTGVLSCNELAAAELSMVRKIQESFVGNEKDIFKDLKVFKDEQGLLRVKTRTIRRKDLVVSNEPYLLHGKHPLVRQLIAEYHRSYAHAGVGFLITKLRKKFWIPKVRKSVNSVISKCLRCRKFNARPVITEAAPLPLDRIRDVVVFEIVGVDLAGPLFLRSGKKVWIVIFTCAVYRAVYLDLVDSLSTKAFIRCMGRFIDKHGRPTTMYSDNGTNFRGAENLFRGLDWEQIQKDEKVKPIKWIFNPPSGPWWGGFWERLIRIVKDLLQKTVGKASLRWKELEFTLKQIEGVMNDRPITYVSENTEDLETLTPNMFLRPSCRFKFPEGYLTEGEKIRLRYRYMMTLAKELKLRFQREYLSLLVSKSRKKPTRPLKVGELVVVHDDLKRRLDWPLGRIIELFTGDDGHSRVAKVRTTGGVLLRPVQRLYPLEVDGETEEGHKMQTRSKSHFI